MCAVGRAASAGSGANLRSSSSAGRDTDGRRRRSAREAAELLGSDSELMGTHARARASGVGPLARRSRGYRPLGQAHPLIRRHLLRRAPAGARRRCRSGEHHVAAGRRPRWLGGRRGRSDTSKTRADGDCEIPALDRGLPSRGGCRATPCHSTTITGFLPDHPEWVARPSTRRSAPRRQSSTAASWMPAPSAVTRPVGGGPERQLDRMSHDPPHALPKRT